MDEYLHQIIFCSQRERRAFRREIRVRGGQASVTAVEKLPPHYELVMDRLRESNERVIAFKGTIGDSVAFSGCPYCSNDNYFVCDCGVLSCSSGQSPHRCPSCKVSHRIGRSQVSPMSKSGLVHGSGIATRQTSALPADIQAASVEIEVVEKVSLPERVPMPLELPAPDKEEAREKLRKFLESKKT